MRLTPGRQVYPMKQNGHPGPSAESEQVGATILIVEDEPEIADLFATLLNMEGFAPVIAHSNPAALDYLQDHTPDLMLLDVMLPGATGLEVCRQTRQEPRLADIPIVIVSARTQESDIEAGMEAGADEYLKKPLSNQLLVDTVRRHLKESKAAHQPSVVVDDLDRMVDKGLNAIQRYLAEIERSQRAYKGYLEKLEMHNERPLTEKQQAARQAAEMVRRQIRRNQAAGWQVLKDLLERIELKESAVRRRGRHEPMNAKEWQLAAARAHFVQEDCRRWAENQPEQILREYDSALIDEDNTYAYLIQRYGTEALEAVGNWEHLSLLRARILEKDEPDQQDLQELDDLYARINPLRARLTGIDLPDALLLVERNQPVRHKVNGHQVTHQKMDERAG